MSLSRSIFALCGAAVIAACQTDQGGGEKPTVSLSEAVKVTAKFEGQAFTPPPRKIEDVERMLKAASGKTPAEVAALKAAANRAAPTGSTPDDRAASLYQRAAAGGELGRIKQMRADLAAALAEGPTDYDITAKILISRSVAEVASGNLRRAIEDLETISDRLSSAGRRLQLAAKTRAALARHKSKIGDMDGARHDLAVTRATIDEVEFRRARRGGIDVSHAEAMLYRAQGWVALNSGQYKEAEAKARAALPLIDREIEREGAREGGSKESFALYSVLTLRKHTKIDILIILARALVHQDRHSEAEIAARDAVSLSVSTFGRNSPYTVQTLAPMIAVLGRTRRLIEARTLSGIAIDILEDLQVDRDGHILNQARHSLAGIMVASGDWPGALKVFASIAEASGGDDALLDRFHRYDLDRAVALLQTDRAAEAARVTGPASRRLSEKLGKKNFETALALGLHAVAMHRQGQSKAALESFRGAYRILKQRSRRSEGGTTSSGLAVRLKLIHEGYLEALARSGHGGASAEAFAVAPLISARSVQAALAQSAARTSIPDPELRRLVRGEQDAQKQIAALYGVLSNALTQGQLAKGKADTLRKSIDQLRGARAALMEEIEARFPEYASLINPKPASFEGVQSMLGGDEAMIVTYVGERKTLVWAIPSKGEVAFAAADDGWPAIQASVEGIRTSLTPDAETLGDIPAFDVAAAHDLYARLLQPVASGWQGAENLFIAAHGPLGYLPFALLPTEPVALGAQREPLFSRYSNVPWLIRNHSVAMLPSVGSLASLRSLPVRTRQQSPFAGFGDPLFSKDDEPTQVAAATTEGAVKTRGLRTRGVRIKLRSTPKTEDLGSAGLEDLPRLPETADEVRRIATALKADLKKDIFLGMAATEAAVKSLDLSAYRVLAFATHGLIPGDLDGLTQPALALSAPAVVGGTEDGLLTMGEILGLKLDADWVVLSACNTGSGEGAGAEAVSGLGRAFFYAGTRALLVSNWPVETTSAMALTTELFGRQAAEPTLGRAKALRGAMLSLIDGPGYVDSETDKSVFSYAHPIFWAPFSLIGDGGSHGPGV